MINPKLIKLFQVAPGAKVRLKQRNPGWAQTEELKELGKDVIKGRAETVLAENLKQLAEAQELLHKWVARAAVADLLTSTISSMHLTYPEVTPEKRQALEVARRQLEEE